MKQAIIFGAGNIGRGFIGQLFSESGYLVTFIDVDAALIDTINARGSYPLEIVSNASHERLQIGPARAIDARHSEAVAEAVSQADIGATAVGANALKFVIPNLCAGLARRAARGAAPFNVIICENLHGAAEHVRALAEAAMAPEARAYLDRSTGFVNTVIGRMVPAPTAEMRADDPSLIRVEGYKELPVDRKGFVGPVPDIAAMTAYDDFEVFTARKLYIHNCGHALMAYAGYLRGYTYGYEAMADAAVRGFMLAGLRESAAAICAAFKADPAWLDAHVNDLLERFSNQALGDLVFRLGRDPLRKLAAEDRLTGAARLAVAHGITPRHLAWGMAAALCFNPGDDPAAAALQKQLAETGPVPTLQAVAGLAPAEPLTALVLEAYAALRQNPRALPNV